MEEANKELKFVDLADILKHPEMIEEAREARKHREGGYRAGYRDAWIVCLETFADALGTDAYTQGWNFWADELRAWIFERQGQRVEPPKLSLQPSEET